MTLTLISLELDEVTFILNVNVLAVVMHWSIETPVDGKTNVQTGVTVVENYPGEMFDKTYVSRSVSLIARP